MDRVNITVTSTAKGPAPQEAAGMFIVEVIRDGVPETFQGSIYREKITGTELAIQLFANAVYVANTQNDQLDTMECYIDNTHICKAFENRWIDSWTESAWKTIKGKPVANADTWKVLLEQIEKSTKKIIVKSGELSSYRNWLRIQSDKRLAVQRKINKAKEEVYGGKDNADD